MDEADEASMRSRGSSRGIAASPWPSGNLTGPFPGGRGCPPAAAGTSRLDSGVIPHDSAPAAGGQGAERPDTPAPHLRPGPGHPADPLVNPADLGEGLGSLHLLCLVDQVSVHRACSWTG